ncbi:MAG: DNA-binding protein, partial [Candidatus Nanohaloarchaea archaeon]
MPDDEELEKLKEERRKELEGSSSDGEEDRRQQIKSQASKYLTSDARSRLGNIRAAKPDLASS